MWGISSREAKDEDDLRVRTSGRRQGRLVGQLHLAGGGLVFDHQIIVSAAVPCQGQAANLSLPSLTQAYRPNQLLQLSECREVYLHEPFAADHLTLRSVNNPPSAFASAVVPVVWKWSIWAVPFPLGSCWQCSTYGFPVWLEEWVTLAFSRCL